MESPPMNRSELLAAAEAQTETLRLAPNVQPLKPVPPAIKFAFEMANDIEITSAPEWAIEGLLPRQGLAAVYGAPGSGKSFLTIDACGHIAAGLDWFGRRVEQGGVVYIAAEAGTGLRKRLAAWRRAHQYEGDLPLALVTVAPNLGTTKDGSDTRQLITDLEKQLPLLAWPVRVIVIDTLARALFGADENSAADMGAFVANCGMIAEAFKCLVIAVHHSGKDAERGMRGSSALHGACDAEWEITDAQGGEKMVLLRKMKEGEDNISWRFSLTQKVVFDPLLQGVETGGKVSDSAPVTSCIVEEAELPKQFDRAKKPKAPTGTNAVVFDAIREAIGLHGGPMPRTADYPSCNGVKRSFIKDILIKKRFGNPDNPKSQSSQINNALTKLDGGGFIKSFDEWVWLCE